jgi:hypothetical protein
MDLLVSVKYGVMARILAIEYRFTEKGKGIKSAKNGIQAWLGRRNGSMVWY